MLWISLILCLNLQGAETTSAVDRPWAPKGQVAWKLSGLSAVQTAVYPGEPVALMLEVSYPEGIKDKEEWEIHYTQLDVHVHSTNGPGEYVGAREFAASAIWAYWPYRTEWPGEGVKPGPPYVVRAPLILNTWFPQVFDPGDYVISIARRPQHSKEPRTVQTPLRVLPQDPEAHRKRLAALYAKRTEGGASGAFLVKFMFETANSEYAVPYQVQYLNDKENWTCENWRLLLALQEEGTVAAAKGIMDFIMSGGEYLKQWDIYAYGLGVHAIYVIREKGDAELKAKTETFCAVHPDVPKPSCPEDGLGLHVIR